MFAYISYGYPNTDNVHCEILKINCKTNDMSMKLFLTFQVYIFTYDDRTHHECDKQSNSLNTRKKNSPLSFFIILWAIAGTNRKKLMFIDSIEQLQSSNWQKNWGDLLLFYETDSDQLERIPEKSDTHKWNGMKQNYDMFSITDAIYVYV